VEVVQKWCFGVPDACLVGDFRWNPAQPGVAGMELAVVCVGPGAESVKNRQQMPGRWLIGAWRARYLCGITFGYSSTMNTSPQTAGSWFLMPAWSMSNQK